MAFQRNIAFIYAATIVLLVAAFCVAAPVTFLRAFARVEASHTRGDVRRVVGALDREGEYLARTAADWGVWDDTYAFIRTGDAGYVAANLSPETSRTLDVDYILLFDEMGRLVYGHGYDPVSSRELPPPALALTYGGEIVRAAGTNAFRARSGYFVLANEPLVVAISPILTTRGEGPARGALVFAKKLDAAAVARLGDVTGLAVSVTPRAASLRGDAARADGALTIARPVYVRPLDAATVAGYARASDVLGNETILVRVLAPRTIYRAGEAAALFVVGVLVAVGVILGVITHVILQRSVITPLARLNRAVREITADAPFGSSLLPRRPDEVSATAAAIIRTLDALYRARNERAESEERFRAIVEVARDCIFVKDRDLKYTHCNPAMAAVFGLPGGALVGKTDTEVFDGDAGVTARAVDERVLAGETVEAEQARAVRGKAVTFDVIEVPLRDAAGDVVGLCGIARDVSRRKEIEAELRIKDVALAKSVSAFVLADVDGRITYVNDAFLQLWGYDDAAEVVGKNSIDTFFVGFDASARGFREPSATGRWVGELEGKRRDGSTFYVSVFATVVADDAGKPLCLTASAVDITERRDAEAALREAHAELEARVRERTAELVATNERLHAEIADRERVTAALRESEELYKSVVATSPDAVFLLDLTGVITYASPRVAEMYRTTPEDLVGRDAFETIAPEERARARESLESLFAVGIYRGVEFTVFRPDGTSFISEMSGALVRGADGQPKGLVATVRDVTARRQGEQALRESEELYKSVVATAPDAVFLADLRGVITYASPRAPEIFAAPPAEIVGRAVLDMVVPEDRAGVRENLAALSATGVVRAAQFTVRRPNGTTFVGEVNSAVFRGADGQPKGLVATVRDITARRRGEQALQESEEKYRGVVEQVQAAVLIIDDVTVRYANDYAARRLGYEPHEFPGRVISDFVAPAARAEVERYAVRRREGDFAPFVYETAAITKAGEEIPVEVHASVVQYEGRAATLAIVHDLTDRQECERVSRERTWILENVVNNMPDTVYVVDPKTYEVLFVNATAAAQLGEDVVGRECYRAIWHLDGPCRACNVATTAASRGGVRVAESYNDKLGKWLRTTYKKVTWLDGRPVRCVVATDISERKALEEEIVAHNVELNRTVRERTSALETKNAELESFAYSVSHDLRAPLRSVEGFSRALLEDYADRVDDEGRDYLNRIVGGAVRMDVLINDLLTYSRLGRRGAQFTGVDMNELVRLSLEDLGENIREAGAHVEVAADLPAVEGDRSMLLVLFDNIIGNAVKFRRPGVPPAVKVTARVDDGLCVFAVADNGIGLDPQYESKIFNIFQRLHTDDEYPGTGIGLASARKVVVAHGGRIWFESAPGQGATFYLELPRAPAHDEGRTDG